MNKIAQLSVSQFYKKTYFLTPCLQVYQIHKESHSLSFSKSNAHSKQLNNTHVFQIARTQHTSLESEDGFVKKMKRKMFGLMGEVTKVNIGACLVYEKCADDVSWNDFFKHFDLPDTFFSWFLSIQLHVWMIALVTISEKNGRVFRNKVIEEMWNDVEQRLEHLTVMRSSTKTQNLKELTSQFQAAMISYDEGILEDDKALAAAAWRILFGFKANIDPRLLEHIVIYIRKQISHLDSQNSEEMMTRGVVTFLPLKDVLCDVDKLENL